MTEIKGYLSVFGNVDSYGDVVMKGAFLDSLSKRMPKFLWQHNSKEPIGVFKVLQEDDYGLYLESEICDSRLGRDAAALVKQGAIDGFSIGYRIAENGFTYDSEKDIFYLTKIDLYEGSLVTFPANDKAVGGLKEAQNWLSTKFTKL